MKILAEREYPDYNGGLYQLASSISKVIIVIEIYDSDYCWWEASCLIFTDEAVEFDPPTAAAQEANRLKETARNWVAKQRRIEINYPIIDGIYPLEELEAVTSEMLKKDWQ